MHWNLIKEQSLPGSPRFRVGVLVALLLLVGAGFLTPAAKRWLDGWQARGAVKRAEGLYAVRDYRRAISEAGKALKNDVWKPEAIRITAKALEAMADRAAIEWRRRLGVLKPGDLENVVGWANDAIKESDIPTAESLLESLALEDRKGAPYHDVAAWIALNRRDAASAEAHWKEAVRLEPSEDKYVQRLWTLHLSSPAPGARTEALAGLDKLAQKPGMRGAALRTILDDAMKHNESAKARDIANTLGNAKEATFADKLTQLGTLRTLKDKDADPLFAVLKRHAASDRAVLEQLLAWMNANEPADTVMEWIATLPENVVSTPPVCVRVADAYAADFQWKRLEEMLQAASWGELEFLRHAHLARALGRLDEAARSQSEWQRADAAAEKSMESMERLARTLLEWGLAEKAEQVLIKLEAREHCPRWVLNTLWSTGIKQGDSPQLYGVSKVLAKADPGNVVHRNNLICLGLLLRDQIRDKHDEMAEALHKQVPANAVVASTYALSLYQRGRLDDALAVMRAVRPAQLRIPSVALYCGIFLNAAGQPEKAREFLAIGASGPLLPEEKALLIQSKAGPGGEFASYLRKLDDAAVSGPDELANLITWMNEHEMGPVAAKWSEKLPVRLAADPKVCMALAESRVSAVNWKRLLDTIEATSWGDLEYLRSAYRALALSRLGDTSGAAIAWKGCILAAQTNIETLERLARAVKGWGWDEKAGEVLWKLSGDSRRPEWVIDSLWELSLDRDDAGGLRKAAGLFVAAKPGRTRARNCAIAIALLDRSNEVAMREFAGTLHRVEPKDVALAAIHAIGLHQQGRTLEAMATMEAFDARALEEPSAAFYHGVFLLASNSVELGNKYLSLVDAAKLPPEEAALLARVRAIRLGDGAGPRPPGSAGRN